MRVFLLAAVLGCLLHSGSYAQFRLWPSLVRGELVYSRIEMTRPLVLSRLEVGWLALTSPEPGEAGGLLLFRLILPAGLLLATIFGRYPRGT